MDNEYIRVKSKGTTIREAWINAFDLLLKYYDEHIPADRVEDGYIITIELNKPKK